MSKSTKEAQCPLTVVARNGGHFGDRHIREGQTFELAAPGDFAASWMTPVGWDPKAPGVKPEPEKDDKASTET